jgi:hypothetical protein
MKQTTTFRAILTTSVALLAFGPARADLRAEQKFGEAL